MPFPCVGVGVYSGFQYGGRLGHPRRAQRPSLAYPPHNESRFKPPGRLRMRASQHEARNEGVPCQASGGGGVCQLPAAVAPTHALTKGGEPMAYP